MKRKKEKKKEKEKENRAHTCDLEGVEELSLHGSSMESEAEGCM